MPAVVLALLLCAQPAADEAPVRVFFAQLQTGQGTSEAEVSLIQNAVLVAARDRALGFDVVAASDVAGLLQAESQASAAGCDSLTCASELADALNAPQLVTGELGRVGDTWLLTLTRIDRDSLGVLARQQVSARGEAPDVLLSRIPDGVSALFGIAAPSVSPLVYAGAAGLALGVVVAAFGGVAHGLSWNEHTAASAAVDAGDGEALSGARDRGEAWVATSLVSYVVGGLLLVAGGGVLAAGLVGVGE